MERYRLLVRKILRDSSLRILPPEPLASRADSLSSPEDTASVKSEKSSFPIDKVRLVRHLERAWFKDQYGSTKWSFLGAGSRLTFLDTARTRDLRARLQARFGAPTRTPAEMDFDEWKNTPDSSRNRPPQFEYWFVVNDSIPVRVTDVNGPEERGVIVSTDRQYRDRLMALRAALLRSLREEERAPYVDYYYDDARHRWYRTGFDGASFFRERIFRRDLVPGRRPRLDTVRTGASDEEEAPSSS